MQGQAVGAQEALWSTVEALRGRSPLVHNIINFVAMDLAANVLLAVGASPVMAHAQEEVADMVAIAGALTINIGTLEPEWVVAMETAANRAVALHKPWVLDPVGAGATPYRDATLRILVGKLPTVIRGNASEILALRGQSAARGVDSANASTDALGVARSLAKELGAVVAVTGVTDYVTDGTRLAAIGNGHPLMTRVTAMGCGLTALVGATLALGLPPFDATVHALAIYGIAGELAAEGAEGPGSFRVRFLDRLAMLDRKAVGRLKLE
ncbi:MAG TPA: hydroxyethylthiazole kinase [Kiloniellales bacterium]|nr:hydroxyethylthiazole kinase [Kiloniellales bacterium]